ncbi:MAG: hypothetical protein NTX25_05600 [Proteobacteria bacterium]|nr:hypothetical protein [Pseudomonadota bacterium]
MLAKLKRVEKRPDLEQGSLQLAAIVGLGMATFLGIYLSNQNQSNLASLREAKSERISTDATDASYSALSRMKALISTKKINDKYLPALYATNYYDLNWQMLHNQDIIGLNKVPLLSPNKVLLKSFKPEGQSKEKLSEIFEGHTSQAEVASDEISIAILRTNFSSNGRLAESLDVMLVNQSKQGSVAKEFSMKARIAIDAPAPYDAKLQISEHDKNQWQSIQESKPGSKSRMDISEGEYDLRLLASGVAFDGDININTIDKATVGGFQLEGGKVKISHKANNYLAKDEEIGRISRQFGANRPNPNVCVFDSKDGNYTIEVVLRGPDGQASSKTTYKIRARAPSINELSDEDFIKFCDKECPFAGPDDHDDAEKSITPYIVKGYFGDLTDFHMMASARYKFKVADKKLCFNTEKAANSYKRDKGKWPTRWTGQLINYASQMEYFSYAAPDCSKREFLFKRNSCGCFAEHTMIRLGDGINEKRVEELNDHDQIWNPITGQSFKIRRMTNGPEKLPLLEISTAKNTLRVTGKHPFPMQDGRTVPAFELKDGESIRDEQGDWQAIRSIRLITSKDAAPTVWNLELDANSDWHKHYILANGLVTGDLFIQNALKSTY